MDPEADNLQDRAAVAEALWHHSQLECSCDQAFLWDRGAQGSRNNEGSRPVVEDQGPVVARLLEVVHIGSA